MKFSYRWLQKYFDEELPAPARLAEDLTFHSFEIDGMEAAGKDTVIDVKITPNRGHDALCHRGIARELAALYARRMHDPLEARPALSPSSQLLSVSVEDARLCPRYSAAVMRGVRVAPSPSWLRERLEAVGQRSINNIVDATNFVMLNIGQPLHAFDLAHLEEREGKYAIAVRQASEGEKLTTLDGVERMLKATALVIGDGHSGKALGVAGVKGGMSSGISEETRDIIIESATFDGASIRKTAKALALRTDASSRFEHGISPELTPYGLSAAVELIGKLAGGTLEGYTDSYPSPQKPRVVSASLSQTTALLGTPLSGEEMGALLSRLGFSYTEVGGAFAVEVPFERLDLSIPEDLIEEVGRMKGLASIRPALPSIAEASEVNRRFAYADRVREALVEAGFSEVYLSSFAPREGGEVEVLNPAAQDRPMLRKDLSWSLARALALNVRNAPLLGLSEVKLFELGAVFPASGEEYRLALAIAAGKRTEEAFAEAEKILASILGPCEAKTRDGVREYSLETLLAKLPEPDAYDLREPTRKVQYRPFSPYPFVLRDIALWARAGVGGKEIESSIRNHAGPLLARLDLFDRFEKGDHTSWAFHLVFQSPEKTLTDAEVNDLMEQVTSALTGEGHTIR